MEMEAFMLNSNISPSSATDAPFLITNNKNSKFSNGSENKNYNSYNRYLNGSITPNNSNSNTLALATYEPVVSGGFDYSASVSLTNDSTTSITSSSVIVSNEDEFVIPFSLAEIILISFILVVLSSTTIAGNIFVVVAFKIEKKLRTVSSYFLLSLAVADFSVGLISMPFYSLYVLYGYSWPFGSVLCDCWLALDYTMSNASVANLLIISFDRYFSVTRPLTYRAKRTPKRAAIMIGCAWVISILLWSPWIFSWPYIEGKRTVPSKDCYIQFLKTNSFITVITALLAFYLPVSIMIYLYYKIWRATENRQKGLVNLIAAKHLNGSSSNNSSSKKHISSSKKNTISSEEDEEVSSNSFISSKQKRSNNFCSFSSPTKKTDGRFQYDNYNRNNDNEDENQQQQLGKKTKNNSKWKKRLPKWLTSHRKLNPNPNPNRVKKLCCPIIDRDVDYIDDSSTSDPPGSPPAMRDQELSQLKLTLKSPTVLPADKDKDGCSSHFISVPDNINSMMTITPKSSDIQPMRKSSRSLDISNVDRDQEVSRLTLKSFTVSLSSKNGGDCSDFTPLSNNLINTRNSNVLKSSERRQNKSSGSQMLLSPLSDTDVDDTPSTNEEDMTSGMSSRQHSNLSEITAATMVDEGEEEQQQLQQRQKQQQQREMIYDDQKERLMYTSFIKSSDADGSNDDKKLNQRKIETVKRKENKDDSEMVERMTVTKDKVKAKFDKTKVKAGTSNCEKKTKDVTNIVKRDNNNKKWDEDDGNVLCNGKALCHDGLEHGAKFAENEQKEQMMNFEANKDAVINIDDVDCTITHDNNNRECYKPKDDGSTSYHARSGLELKAKMDKTKQTEEMWTCERKYNGGTVGIDNVDSSKTDNHNMKCDGSELKAKCGRTVQREKTANFEAKNRKFAPISVDNVDSMNMDNKDGKCSKEEGSNDLCSSRFEGKVKFVKSKHKEETSDSDIKDEQQEKMAVAISFNDDCNGVEIDSNNLKCKKDDDDDDDDNNDSDDDDGDDDGSGDNDAGDNSNSLCLGSDKLCKRNQCNSNQVRLKLEKEPGRDVVGSLEQNSLLTSLSSPSSPPTSPDDKLLLVHQGRKNSAMTDDSSLHLCNDRQHERNHKNSCHVQLGQEISQDNVDPIEQNNTTSSPWSSSLPSPLGSIDTPLLDCQNTGNKAIMKNRQQRNQEQKATKMDDSSLCDEKLYQNKSWENSCNVRSEAKTNADPLIESNQLNIITSPSSSSSSLPAPCSANIPLLDRRKITDSERITSTRQTHVTNKVWNKARSQQDKKMRCQDKKAAKTLTAILLVFIITWTPYNIFAVLQVFCEGCINNTVYAIGYWLCYLNSTINPFCYALCNVNFRTAFMRIICCRRKSRPVQRITYTRRHGYYKYHYYLQRQDEPTRTSCEPSKTTKGAGEETSARW
ncbi:muscarinic acetylcholine receptor DM1-like [Octopus vulgaris]|uniref:Muscarinic acetylcholine receptor DM1-like n=1 Tax=Octopus vulgaris TaxID=6645 RepID=A0AA36FLQ1_OCTVU|nr:muscarinic acetylcholine receptor DM1-like [Octopus vulgaris]